MNEFFAYLMESTVCMLIFWAVYLILLRRTTFFRLNRLYLIMSLIISMIIPLISIPTEQSNSLQLRPQMQSLANEIVVSPIEPINNISVQNIQVDNSQVEVSDDVNYGVIAYLLVSVLLFLFYSYSIFRIFRLRRNSQIMEIKGLRVAVSNQDNITPFSFLKTFYFSKKLLLNSDFDHIIEHEAGHIKHLHSLDLIGICILKSIFWCNPMIYIIEKSLKENHEFTADKIVIKKGVQPRYYKELLLRSTYADLFSAPVNSFSMSIIKKRFNMLDKNNSSRKSLIKYAAFLPILALLIAMFACGGNKEQTKSDKSPTSFANESDKIQYISQFKVGDCFDANGRKIPGDSARRYLMNGLSETIVGRKDIPNEAVKAGITNAAINVKCVVAPDGKIVSAEAEGGKILNGTWQKDIGYGYNLQAEKALLHANPLSVFSRFGDKKSDSLIPSYYLQSIVVHFGDYEVWNAIEKSCISIYGSKEYFENGKRVLANEVEFDKMENFIDQNLIYPKSEIKSNISGKVTVNFKVDVNNKIQEIKIKSGINPSFDNEALRVISLFASSGINICTGTSKTTLQDSKTGDNKTMSKINKQPILPENIKYSIDYPIEFSLK